MGSRPGEQLNVKRHYAPLHVPMKNKSFFVFAACTLVLGILLGYSLAWHAAIKPHKILLVIGSFYNLLAVIVLSEVFTTQKRHREIALNYIAPAVLWLHTLIPLGAILGALCAQFLVHASGGSMAFRFSAGVFVYSLVPLGLFDAIVVFPRKAIYANPETRWKYFGLFMITSGILLQLIAAIIDVGA